MSVLSGLVFVLVTNGAPPPEGLTTVARRVAQTLLKKDWAAFRRDAARVVSVEEKWRAHKEYLTPKFEFSLDRGVLGAHDHMYIGYLSVLPNQAKLNAAQAKMFREFCERVKESRSYWSDGWGIWPPVYAQVSKKQWDSSITTGPCCGSTIVSNADWVVEFEKSSGRWLASRLILIAH